MIVTDLSSAGHATAASVGAEWRQLDVRDENQWRETADWTRRTFGRLDVVVNNAGITGLESDGVAHDPEYVDLEHGRAVHRTNLDGVLCKYVIQSIRPAGTGSIIHISSRAGIVGISGAAAYASSKAVARNHTKTMALYCAEQRLGDPLQFDPFRSNHDANVGAGARPRT